MDKRSIPQKYVFYPLDVLNIQTARGVNNGHMLIQGFHCYKLTRKCCKKGYWTFYCDSPNCNKKMYLLFGTMKAGEGPERHTCLTNVGEIGGYPQFGRCTQHPNGDSPAINLPIDIPPFPNFSVESVQAIYVDLDKSSKAESFQLRKPNSDRNVLNRHHISLPYQYKQGMRGVNIKIFVRMKGPQNKIFKIYHEIKHRYPVVRGTIVQVDSINRRIYFTVLRNIFPNTAPEFQVDLTVPAMKILKQRQALQTFGVAMLDGKLVYCAQYPPIPNLGGRSLEVTVHIAGVLKGTEGFRFICEGKFRTVSVSRHRKPGLPGPGMSGPRRRIKKEPGRNNSGVRGRIDHMRDEDEDDDRTEPSTSGPSSHTHRGGPLPPPHPGNHRIIQSPPIKKGGVSETSLTGFSIGSDVGLSIDNPNISGGLSGGEDFGNSSGGEGSFYGSSLEGNDSYPSSEEENMFVKEMFGLTDKTDDVLF